MLICYFGRHSEVELSLYVAEGVLPAFFLYQQVSSIYEVVNACAKGLFA